MKQMRRFLSIGVSAALLLALGLFITSAQDEPTDGVARFVHVVPGVEPIDVFVNGTLTVTNLAFGEATGYINLPAGEHTVTVRQVGQPTTLWEQTITVDGTKPTTWIASSLDLPQFAPYQDLFEPLALGSARFMIIHALEGAPGVDLLAGSDSIITDLQYSQFLGTIDIPSNVYEIAALVAGTEDEVIEPIALPLVAGESQMFILYGTPDEPETMLISAPVPAADEAGFVRIVHGAGEAPDVDVYVNEVLIVPALSFGQYTEHLALEAGDYTVELRGAGTTETVLEADLTVEAGTAQTIVALEAEDGVTVGVFADDISGVTPQEAALSVINTLPGEATVSVTLDETALAEELPSGESSSATVIDPVIASPSVTFTIEGASPTVDLDPVVFYGGVYYNLIALGGSSPRLIVAPTYLAQTLGSAPGAEDAAPVVEAEPTEAEVVEATEVVVAVPATPTPAAAQPTQPVVAATPVPSLPTARVVLDPGANLQLRQYPNSDALSLGLAPSGSTLLVNGREGAPVDPTGAEIPLPSGELFQDPALLLESEQTDLVPGETWLNVTFNTADGGAITAWVNAQYVDVRAPNGGDQRLAELPTIPGNQPGEAVNTAVAPPPVQEDRVVVVVTGLEATVNLNIRRVPDPNAEVLARVPNGTELEFNGLGASRNWVFVRYTADTGSIVTGWVNIGFVEFRFRDQRIEPGDLEVRGLLLTADEATERGEITQGTGQAVQPTADVLADVFVAEPLVNANANLNLRRNPTDQAEVLARIPAGSRVVITGRTADSLWLQGIFDDQTGWVAASFVRLTFNGRTADVSELPVIEVTLPVLTPGAAATLPPTITPTPTGSAG
ncbi:MAG: DUF4397 domain-containing protein [bacterium]|nr:DUF4397 domain-containing protein [bacterium]